MAEGMPVSSGRSAIVAINSSTKSGLPPAPRPTRSTTDSGSPRSWHSARARCESGVLIERLELERHKRAQAAPPGRAAIQQLRPRLRHDQQRRALGASGHELEQVE